MDNSPAAYNQSIYVMVGVPYACFAVFGFIIYRGFKKNEHYRKQMWALTAGPSPPDV